MIYNSLIVHQILSLYLLDQFDNHNYTQIIIRIQEYTIYCYVETPLIKTTLNPNHNIYKNNMNTQGKLIIKPKQARIDRNTEWFGKMDPFVKFQFERQNAQSEVDTAGGYNPTWNNPVTFNRLIGNLLYIALMDHEAIKQHDTIGTTEIDISDVFCKTESTTRWVNLFYDGRKSAEIQIEFFFQAIELAPSNLKSNGTGCSLMMSKKSKMGQKHNIYQQPQLFQQSSSNQQNPERSQKIKPPSYGNQQNQYYSKNQSKMQMNYPVPYRANELNYQSSSQTNSQKQNYPQPYIAQKKSKIEKSNVVNNPYESRRNFQEREKVNSSKKNPNNKFTADEMDRFLDD